MNRKKQRADIIKDFCRQLRLPAIAENFEELESRASDYEDYLCQLLALESESKDNRQAESRIKAARFPYRKYLEDLETEYLPISLQRMLPELVTLGFIDQGQNLIFVGNPGTGKTHTAIGLGIRACQQGYRVLFTTVPLLVTELKENNSERHLQAFQKRFARYDLVIADELGYISFDREGADLLFTCLSLRSASKSIIITSNLTFERWSEIFGDPAITGAMVDRLTFGARLIDMTGDSYRQRSTLKANGIANINQVAGTAETTAVAAD